MHTSFESTYRHLIFDNSLTDGNYYFSEARVILPSQLEGIRGRIPVDSDVFFSPANSLRLSWTSNTGGDWYAEVQVGRWRGRKQPFIGTLFSIWFRSEQPIPAESLPSLQVSTRQGKTTHPLRLGRILGDLPAGQWVQARIPFSAFDPSTGDIPFLETNALIFSQSIDDAVPHTLWVDEIRILPEQIPAMKASLKAFSAIGMDHHVDLSWEIQQEEGVLYYLIERSHDGKFFLPIGIQNPGYNRYVDYSGSDRRTFYYRLSAIGQDYSQTEVLGQASTQTHLLTENELLDMVQESCFRYYWEAAHPACGMARECIPGEENLIALGASGFGVLATLVAAKRGFVSRTAAIERLDLVTHFLEKADRFHGVWPHFLDGRNGQTFPVFGRYDNGGDIVETSFMIEGLLAARIYFDRNDPLEIALRNRITTLWETIEWDWYTHGPNPNFLYWHWSPDAGFHIDHPLIGWNETMIAYLLAVASPTHPIPPEMYYNGWASESSRAVEYRQNWGRTTHGDHYINGHTYDDIQLDVGVGSGGPLFFLHYSFMGFDPRGKRDRFTNYFRNSRAIALINQRYCMANPGRYREYSQNFWGLTASDDHTGYLAHEASPHSDNGTISPTGALACMPYTPSESLAALRQFYYNHGRQMWGIYGFRDAFNPTENFVSDIFMGLNQAPIMVMIENYRSGLIWRLFMSNPEISLMLHKLGFVADNEDETPI